MDSADAVFVVVTQIHGIQDLSIVFPEPFPPCTDTEHTLNVGAELLKFLDCVRFHSNGDEPQLQQRREHLYVQFLSWR